ncbi:hypothetical protein CDD81_2639 [Ophiocordyceps australis]|uniref:Uncharacterized protein n=1 Tax=Ophiocordyceps australis TaxID=1399860 RepID=A0A2C5XYM8_9HYPO|nr:hypothetical protein CDD81_2639 [Ophiocordyceps australis]
MAHAANRLRLQYSPGEGAYIIEIQLTVLKFLNKVCKALVPSPLDQSRADENAWSALYILPKTDDLYGPSLGARVMTAPFQPPKQINFDRLVAILEALGACSANHLFSLRTDPGYWNEWLRDAAEHHVEHILDINGQLHPHLTAPSCTYYWARVIRTTILWSYFAADIHPLLARAANELKDEYVQHSTPLNNLEPLPKRIEDAVLYLRYFLDRAIRGLLFTFRQCAQGSPPLRRLFRREICSVSNDDPAIMEAVPHDITIEETEAVRLLTGVWDSPRGMAPVVLSPTLDELDR